jgi:hypothetical protein
VLYALSYQWWGWRESNPLSFRTWSQAPGRQPAASLPF